MACRYAMIRVLRQGLEPYEDGSLGGFDSPQTLARFQREAQAESALNHPFKATRAIKASCLLCR